MKNSIGVISKCLKKLLNYKNLYLHSIKYEVQINEFQFTFNPKNHKNTLIWIHGFNQNAYNHVRYIFESPIIDEVQNFRIVFPKSPKKFVTAFQGVFYTWYEMKSFNNNRFSQQFQNSISVADIYQNYEKYNLYQERLLKPIIVRQHNILNGIPKKIFLGGYSQGASMAFHSLYETNIQLAGVIGVAGSLLPISRFNQKNVTQKRILYGDCDEILDWKYVKDTYQNKFKVNEIKIIKNMQHNLKNMECLEEIAKFIRQNAEINKIGEKDR